MYRSLLEIPFQSARRFPERVSHKSKSRSATETRSYSDLARLIRVLAAGFAAAGVRKGDHVGFFVNNRYEWIATDFALMAIGAVSVPRGSDTPPKETAFIFRHSDSCHVILETASQLDALSGVLAEEDWARCSSIFIVEGASPESIPEPLRARTVFYAELQARGAVESDRDPGLVERLMADIHESDLLTIVYTSGTTGNPKGVMLTHRNFLQNVHANTPRLGIDPEAAETTVIMLPSWHVYERAYEYCGLSAGVTFVYSSPGRFSADLVEEKPQLLISVPRVWESVYQKLIRAIGEMPPWKRRLVFLLIRLNTAYLSSAHYLRGCYLSLARRRAAAKTVAWVLHVARASALYAGHRIAGLLFEPFREKVGGRLRLATCGAGSLPRYLDETLNAIGIPLVNAYGMTECAPGIVSRTIERNTAGSTGLPFDNTEVVIRRVDGTEAGIGEKGTVFVRGPQVMQGYYKNPEATSAVLDREGWLDTGDLAVRSENLELVIVGRAKDTIVLMGGENVEPEPIEEKMKESAYIGHAVVLGQDQKQLSAIIAVSEEALQRLAAKLGLSPADVATTGEHRIENDRIHLALLGEVDALISRDQGFRPFERIARILPVLNDFSVGKELTQTLKVKRKYVEERFAGLVARILFDGTAQAGL
jgi:long-chain acyl-CoA synthetase